METQAKVNRILLATTGVVLLGGGLLVLAGGLDLYGRWNLAPPDGWPLTTPDNVLLTHADRVTWSHQGWWWWPAVIAALAVITLLALWWLSAQLRRHRPGTVPLGRASSVEGVELRAHALSDALEADAARLPGVDKAQVHLTGRQTHPEALISLTLIPGSAPVQTLGQLYSGPVERARDSAALAQLPTRTRLRVANSRPHRVD